MLLIQQKLHFVGAIFLNSVAKMSIRLHIFFPEQFISFQLVRKKSREDTRASWGDASCEPSVTHQKLVVTHQKIGVTNQKLEVTNQKLGDASCEPTVTHQTFSRHSISVPGLATCPVSAVSRMRLRAPCLCLKSAPGSEHTPGMSDATEVGPVFKSLLFKQIRLIMHNAGPAQ